LYGDYARLLDNFEWFLGYGPTSGLVAVDRVTQVRTPKPRARWLGSVARANALPASRRARAAATSVGRARLRRPSARSRGGAQRFGGSPTPAYPLPRPCGERSRARQRRDHGA